MPSRRRSGRHGQFWIPLTRGAAAGTVAVRTELGRLIRGEAVNPRLYSRICHYLPIFEKEGVQTKTAAAIRGGRRGHVLAPGICNRGDRLRENDLDAPVLRLAHAWRRWDARVVHAAACDNHIAARHAEPFEGGRHRVGAPFGKPLVVSG